MDVAHFKKLLLDKQAELLPDIARLESEAREARQAEVEDPIDEVTSSEGRTAAFQTGSMEWQTLTEVRDALRRIDEGSYGVCEDCGRPIAPARLEAAPWTRYCRDDQEKHDNATETES